MPVGDAGVELYVIDLFDDAELVHDTSARNGYFTQQENQPGAYFSPRLRPGSCQWSRATGTQVEGSVRISLDRVSSVDIR
jgi:hypothetical protein